MKSIEKIEKVIEVVGGELIGTIQRTTEGKFQICFINLDGTISSVSDAVDEIKFSEGRGGRTFSPMFSIGEYQKTNENQR